MANTIALLLCLAVLWVGIEAHGSLSYPITRDKVNGVRLDLQDAPVSGYTGKDFVCRNQPAGSPVITLVAGQTFPMRWDFGAAHVGDCAVYVSYDVNVADDQQKKFYKITTNNNPQPATTSTTNQNTQTPSGTGTQTQSSSPSAYVCESYKVQTGDTLSIIAANYSVTLNEILKDNPQITNANLIFVGDVISICRGSKMNFAGQLQVDVFLIIMALVCALMAYAI
eukprot:Colp12_sorted_trinity150504_noHs@29874